MSLQQRSSDTYVEVAGALCVPRPCGGHQLQTPRVPLEYRRLGLGCPAALSRLETFLGPLEELVYRVAMV